MVVRTEEYYLSMGPQHPSTHGVLRLILKLDGEVILQATPDMGYIHRGLEKIAENRFYLQFIPLTDRLDYLSSMNNNLAYILTVEKLANITPPPRAEYRFRDCVPGAGRRPAIGPGRGREFCVPG